MVTEVSEGNFEQEVLQAAQPVAVDFWAMWCGHCRRLAPVLERVAEQYRDSVRFVKLNIDQAPALAERYAIEVIPTLVLFKDGKAVASAVNPASQAALTQWLTQQI